MLASPASVEKPVSVTARRPKPTIWIRSDARFASANVRAPAVASRSDFPAIERERSTASTMLLARPRFTPSRPVTGTPFSVSAGIAAPACDATTLTDTLG